MRCHYAGTASVLLITSSLLLLFEAADSLSNQAADSLSNRAPSQPHEAFSRRGFLVLPVAFGVGPPLARAEDFSFGAQKRSPLNPLTSKPLEALRIMVQEDQNEKYGGELASPTLGMSSGSNVASVSNTPGLLLVPIARIEAQLKEMRQHGYFDDPQRWEEARTVLSTRVLPKKDFKKAFNNFADNIYYSAADSDRANAYLMGGATPSTMQTTQYMLRNEVLGNVELAEQELTYLIGLRNGDTKPSKEELTSAETLEDITVFLDKAIGALDSYLKIPNADDVAKARKSVVTAGTAGAS